jgi:DNA-binding NtrC family response regulator
MRIELPPLRDRKEDIPELARAFAARFAKRMEGKGKRIGDRAMDMLMSYPYPGNVRELENVIERAMILADGDELEPSDFSFLSPITATVVSGNVTLAELERRAILEALERNGGKRAKTAEELGISRRTLLNKLTEYGVQDSGDD